MDPAARLLRLLSLLQARPWWGGAELAARLGVTTRTVRRDVTRLRDLGYPVEADPGPLGGYQLGSGGALPPLLLGDDEAVAVALGLRTAAQRGIVGLEDAAVAALAKLEQVLPTALRERVAALSSATVGLPAAPAPAVDAATLVLLALACRRGEQVRFGYRDRQGQASRRDVEPYRLVHAVGRWYLVGRDRRRADWRTFRVDRIAEPLATGVRFRTFGGEANVAPPDAAALVAEGMALRPYHWQATVLLRLSPTDAARRVPPTVGILEPEGADTLLRVGGDSLDMLARFLVSLACAFQVRDPPELRATLRALGTELLNG